MEDLTKEQAARALGLSESSIDRLRREGELTSFRARSKVRIPAASVAAYKERQLEKALAHQRLRGYDDFIWLPKRELSEKQLQRPSVRRKLKELQECFDQQLAEPRG